MVVVDDESLMSAEVNLVEERKSMASLISSSSDFNKSKESYNKLLKKKQ